jgi:hypothetical protein
LKNKSFSLLSVEPRPSYYSIQDFLLSGFFIYDAKANKPFGFKLGLPDGLLKISADFSPSLSGLISDVLSVDELIVKSRVDLEIDSLEAPDESRNSWKVFCIQTSYGYWSHESFRTKIQRNMASKESANKHYYEELRFLFKSKATQIADLIFTACAKLNDDIILSRKSERWTAFEDKEKFKLKINKYIKQVNRKLDTEIFFNRLVLGVSIVKVPILSNDVEAAEYLEQSFVEDLAEKLIQINSSGSKSRNEIAKIFYTELNRDESTDIDSFDISTLENLLAQGKANEWFS